MSKHEAIDRVEVCNAEWIDWAMHAVYADMGCSRGDQITSDDLWELMTRELDIIPREPIAMGAVMRRLHRDGYIKPLNKWQPSSRACCHGRPVRVWVVE